MYFESIRFWIYSVQWNVAFCEITSLLSLHTYQMGERRMTTFLNMLTTARVEEIYGQLIEHFGDKFSDPIEAVNRATHFLSKYYLNIEE